MTAGVWPTRPLAECGRLLSGGTPSKANDSFWTGAIPWFSSKELKSFELRDSELHVSVEGAASGSNLVPAGSVLFVVRGMSLANEFRVGLTLVDATFNQDVKAVVPANDVDPRYLARCLRSLEPHVLGAAEESSHGTKRLPGHVFENLAIPLPPLPEQRRIADILDKADAIRRKRREAIALTEELLRSAFLEMFGDPVTNPKGWAAIRIDEVAHEPGSLVDGPFGSSLKPEHYTATGVRVVRNYNINDDFFDDSQFKYVTEAKFEELRRSEVSPGDVLITTKGTVGDVCLMPKVAGPSVLSASGTVRLRVPDDVGLLPEFVVAQMIQPTFKRYLHSFEAGSAQQYLNLSGIRKMRLIRPDISEQRSLVEKRKRIRAVQRRLAASLDQSSGLFDALVHRAFRGDIASS